MSLKNIVICLGQLILRIALALGLSQCSSGAGEETPGNNSLVEPSFAYDSWPNDSTTDVTSKQIVSKVLVSDLDFDGL